MKDKPQDTPEAKASAKSVRWTFRGVLWVWAEYCNIQGLTEEAVDRLAEAFCLDPDAALEPRR